MRRITALSLVIASALGAVALAATRSSAGADETECAVKVFSHYAEDYTGPLDPQALDTKIQAFYSTPDVIVAHLAAALAGSVSEEEATRAAMFAGATEVSRSDGRSIWEWRDGNRLVGQFVVVELDSVRGWRVTEEEFITPTCAENS